jgi:hypothetical protein
MAIGLILGVSLVVTGLVLMCHLSYTNLGFKEEDDDPDNAGRDVEDPSMGVERPGKHHHHHNKKENDCILPFCFFQVARVTNHESWIVACLLSGATVLVLSIS